MKVYDFDCPMWTWKHSQGVFPWGREKCVLPYVYLGTDKSGRVVDLDLGSAKVLMTKPVNELPNKNGQIFWGTMAFSSQGTQRELLLLLEVTKHIADRLGEITVRTPPGRPGSPATLVIDQEDTIVPEVTFVPEACPVMVYFLDRSWKGFGFDQKFPAVGLRFTNGACRKSKAKILLWEEFLKRNRS